MYKPRFKNFIDRQLNYGREQIDEFLFDINKHGYKRVLDIGAGHGDDLLNAGKYSPNAELHGIEIYETYAEELRQKGITVHSLNIEYDKFPFDSESIDLIIANQIIEHTKEIYWLFHEITRVLKIGGSLIIGVPNLAALHNRLLLFFGEQPSCIQNNSAHVRGFTRKDLLKFLNSCFSNGYNLNSFKGSNFYPFPSFGAKPLSKIFPNFAWGIFLLLEKRKPYGKQFLEFPVDNQLETNFYLGN
jgi:ubiquinone/menaquinone biosynthesis C-methylase UbiE